MRRSFLFVILAAALVSAAPTLNWTGYGTDTYTDITDSLGASQVKYSDVYQLSSFEDSRIVLCVDDTSSAGFASDSIVIEWGYQTGSVVLNSSDALDTLWDDRIVMDTISTDSAGIARTGIASADGSLTRYWEQHSDTSSVSGYMCQSRWFVPEWDILVRFWVNGLTGNELGSTQKIRFQFRQRKAVNVQGR